MREKRWFTLRVREPASSANLQAETGQRKRQKARQRRKKQATALSNSGRDEKWLALIFQAHRERRSSRSTAVPLFRSRRTRAHPVPIGGSSNPLQPPDSTFLHLCPFPATARRHAHFDLIQFPINSQSIDSNSVYRAVGRLLLRPLHVYELVRLPFSPSPSLRLYLSGSSTLLFTPHALPPHNRAISFLSVLVPTRSDRNTISH